MSRAASAATSISLRCPICWDTFCSPVLTPCGHRFCEACVKTALTVKKECPSCRQPVKSHRALRVDTAFFAATESSGVRSAMAVPLLDECLASCDAEWNCRGCTLANPAAAERCATCHARRPARATYSLLPARNDSCEPGEQQQQQQQPQPQPQQPQQRPGAPLAAADAVEGAAVVVYFSDVSRWCRGSSVSKTATGRSCSCRPSPLPPL